MPIPTLAVHQTRVALSPRTPSPSNDDAMVNKLAHAARLGELKTGLFYRDLAIEFFATGLLLCIVGGLAAPFDGKHASLMQASVCAGLGVAIIVWGAVSTSGSHINPAISIAVMLAGHVSIVRGIGYSVAQCAGAYFGILFMQSLTPKDLIGPHYGVTRLNPELSPLQGCFMEALLTFFLAFTIFAYVDKERPEMKSGGPLIIGLSVTMTHLFGVPYSGCSINPARSFGPALATGYWQDHWIYWVGPIMGCVIAIFAYDYVIRSNASPEKLKTLLLCQEPSSIEVPDLDYNGIQMNENVDEKA